MAFQQGLSGLAASSRALDVTSNNIANASTVGFKQAKTHFADVYASSLQGAGAADQVGIGVTSAAVAQQFTQGNITSTNNPMDMAINGSGFFAVSSPTGDSKTFTRNGQFHVNKDGMIVNDAGLVLRGTLADANGAIPPIVPGTDKLAVDFVAGKPKATTAVTLSANLDSRSLTPAGRVYGAVLGSQVVTPATLVGGVGGNNQLQISIDGTPATLTLTPGTYSTASDLAAEINAQLAGASLGARVTAIDGALKLETTTLGAPGSMQITATNSALGFNAGAASAGVNFNVTDPTTYTHSTAMTVYDSLGNPHSESFYFIKTPVANQWTVYTALDNANLSPAATVNFTTQGAITTALTSLSPTFALTNGSTTPLSTNIDLSGVTQYGTNFSVSTLTQDGNTAGNLAGITVGKDGMIQARYDNGQTKNVGQIALFDFRNPNGLESLGNNQWSQTTDSGQPIPGTPTTGTFGTLLSGSTEDSNVDMTSELVSMIVQQRNYQASAQSIKTQDQIMQTLVNLR